MIFQSKYDRAWKLQKEQNQKRKEESPLMEDTSLEEEMTPGDIVEKGDILAMTLSAFVTFVPIVLVILLLLCGVSYFLLM